MIPVEAIRESACTDLASEPILLSEVLSALSFALDLTEGAMPGHALRSCLLGMRIAESIGLTGEQVASLYYALLLKDIGCSSNAARMCQIVGGDDRAIKAGVKLEDWTKPPQAQPLHSSAAVEQRAARVVAARKSRPDRKDRADAASQ